jgi:tetratricopeptide (TPR) repeat protein
MRIKFLIAGLLALVTAAAFAQKGELRDATEAYNKYELLSKSGAGSLANSSLNTAKTSIDKAAENAKTSGLAETYALKASVYASLALIDTSLVKTAPLFNTADEALKKALELDTKGDNKKMIDNAKTLLAQYQLNKGVKQYKQKKYELAYHSFEYYQQAFPTDTNAMYFSGLSAVAYGNYPATITNYTKLLATPFSLNRTIYFDLSSIYLAQKDTLAALKIVSEGVQKFPANSELRKREIEISLQMGKQKEALEKLKGAIANDPKNKTLYYYAGLTYTILAEGIAKDIRKTKDAAVKADLQTKKDEDFKKASDMYMKAIEIDPNYFEANLSLGYALMSPAIDIFNAANQLSRNEQKEYEADMVKSTAQFNLAKPYLLKAVELKPNSMDALSNLKTYYLGTKDPVHANEIQKRIEALH